MQRTPSRLVLRLVLLSLVGSATFGNASLSSAASRGAVSPGATSPGAPSPGAASPPGATLPSADESPPDDDAIVMRWSYPRRATPDLVAWHQRHATALLAVEDAWARLLRRLGGQIPARFAIPCERLADRLDGLDEATLLPAPERLLDLYLQRMLWHLRQAGSRCRPDQLWNVVHHLEEARHALGEVRWILRRHGLEPRPQRGSGAAASDGEP